MERVPANVEVRALSNYDPSRGWPISLAPGGRTVAFMGIPLPLIYTGAGIVGVGLLSYALGLLPDLP